MSAIKRRFQWFNNRVIIEEIKVSEIVLTRKLNCLSGDVKLASKSGKVLLKNRAKKEMVPVNVNPEDITWELY